MDVVNQTMVSLNLVERPLTTGVRLKPQARGKPWRPSMEPAAAGNSRRAPVWWNTTLCRRGKTITVVGDICFALLPDGTRLVNTRKERRVFLHHAPAFVRARCSEPKPPDYVDRYIRI